MTTDDRVDANRPTARQVIDGDTYVVELDLTPVAAGLINDIALALRGNGHLMTLLANNRVGSPEHTNIRAAIVARLQATQALTLTLGPDQAQDLQGELFEAAEQPGYCIGCVDGANYATGASGLCDLCEAASEFRNALAGGRL